jgi:hypothetical protein
MTTAKEIRKAYKKIISTEQEEREVGKRCFAYVNNWVDGKLGQWTTAQRSAMGDRPMLSLNEIRKFVNRICGAQRGAKVEEKVLPRDDESDPLIADILTDLVKFVYDNNKAEKIHIPRSFRDMVIWRGYGKVEWSDEYNPLGDICIKSIDPMRVRIWGKGERYDLLDRKGIIEVLPMDKEEAIERWSGKKAEIEALVGKMDENLEPKQGGEDYSGVTEADSEDYFDTNTGKCLILRTQKYEYVTVTFLKMPDGSLEEVKSKDIPPGLPLLKKKMKKLYVYYTIGDVELESKPSTNKHNKFDIVQFAAYTDGGRVTSPTQDLLDPQDEKNKRRSQIIHILNSSPRNNYFVSNGAFADIKVAEKQMGGINQLIEVNKPLNECVAPIQSNLSAVPAIIGMEQAASQDMREISGLGDASLGTVPEGVKSGRGIEALQAPTETIIAEIFDNYLVSRQLMADLVLSLIQQYYTDYRRVRILGDYTNKFLSAGDQQVREQIKAQVQMAMPMASSEEVDAKTNQVLTFQPGTKLLAINIQMGEKRLNDVSVGKYDVVFDHVSQNPTTRRAQYYDLLNLVGLGIPVPPKRIIEASDMRNKQELINDIEEAQQAQAQAQAVEQAMGIQQEQQKMAMKQKGATPSKGAPAPAEGQMFNRAGNQMPQFE